MLGVSAQCLGFAHDRVRALGPPSPSVRQMPIGDHVTLRRRLCFLLSPLMDDGVDEVSTPDMARGSTFTYPYLGLLCYSLSRRYDSS